MSLRDKLDAVGAVAVAAHLPQAQLTLCAWRMAAGHAEHGDDCSGLDLCDELREEIADVACYAALARLQGRWTWRLRLVAWLSGLQWRLLRG